ncbi:MAG: hypothetical protein IPK08_10070, partial [Bacteroidetes bacterium]|nr:hypothetical protein [Bacteroidota bacterium]
MTPIPGTRFTMPFNVKFGLNGPAQTVAWVSGQYLINSSCTPVSNGTTQPQSQILTSGQVATFNVSVNGTPPFSYYWYKNSNFVVSTT